MLEGQDNPKPDNEEKKVVNQEQQQQPQLQQHENQADLINLDYDNNEPFMMKIESSIKEQINDIVTSVLEKCEKNSSLSSSSSSTLTKSDSNESSLSSIKSDDNSINEKESYSPTREKVVHFSDNEENGMVVTKATTILTDVDNIVATLTIKHGDNGENVITTDVDTAKYENKTTIDEQHERKEVKFDEESKIGEPIKLHYRYSKEFLDKIRNERSKFIEQIIPDIFKAYCYCMNGKYWNPEKYFDVVQYQFPDELDKVKRATKQAYSTSKQQFQQPLQERNRIRSFNSTSQTQQQQQPNRNRMNSSTSSRRSTNSNPSKPVTTNKPNNNKRTPKPEQQQQQQQQNKDNKQNNRKKSEVDSSSSKKDELKQDEATKFILNLLKTTKQPQQQEQVPKNENTIPSGQHEESNILNKLFNANNSPSARVAKSQQLQSVETNILDLINKSSANKSVKQQKHIITAEELERQQMYQYNSHKNKEFEINNIFDKLLDKNSSSTKPAVYSQQQQQQELFYNDDLNNNNLINKLQQQHQHHHQHQQSSTTTFPAINPRENPFQNILNKNHECQLNQTVHNALNQILKSSSSSSASSSSIPSSSSSTNTSPSKLHEQQVINNNIELFLNKLKLNSQPQPQQYPVSSCKPYSNINNENEHFNLLLNKMSAQPQPQHQQQQQQQSPQNILKWFNNTQQRRTNDDLTTTIKHHLKLPDNVAVLSVKDIEN